MEKRKITVTPITTTAELVAQLNESLAEYGLFLNKEILEDRTEYKIEIQK
jgi:hypothetical protein